MLELQLVIDEDLEVTLKLEHSLASISKWESEFEKPFLTKEPKTPAETLAYVKAMVLDENVSPEVWAGLTDEHVGQVQKYIDAPRTGTWFLDLGRGQTAQQTARQSAKQVTSELVYYWMVTFNVPFECQYWHFNRLSTLLKICSVENAPNEKVPAREAAEQRRRLNAERRARLNTTG